MTNNDIINKIFENKIKFHKSAAKLPIEEKIKRLVELQKIVVAIKATDKKPFYE